MEGPPRPSPSLAPPQTAVAASFDASGASGDRTPPRPTRRASHEKNGDVMHHSAPARQSCSGVGGRRGNAKQQWHLPTWHTHDCPDDKRNLIFFDWDDTLCHTAALRGMVGRGSDDPQLVRRLDEVASRLLRVAVSEGKVMIVTSANVGWVETKAIEHFPQLTKLIDQHQIEILSATERFPDPKFAYTKKAMMVAEELQMYPKGRFDTVIAIGDDNQEMEAVKHVTTYFDYIRGRTVKLMPLPTTRLLVTELERLEPMFLDVINSTQRSHWDMEAILAEDPSNAALLSEYYRTTHERVYASLPPTPARHPLPDTDETDRHPLPSPSPPPPATPAHEIAAMGVPSPPPPVASRPSRLDRVVELADADRGGGPPVGAKVRPINANTDLTARDGGGGIRHTMAGAVKGKGEGGPYPLQRHRTAGFVPEGPSGAAVREGLVMPPPPPTAVSGRKQRDKKDGGQPVSAAPPTPSASIGRPPRPSGVRHKSRPSRVAHPAVRDLVTPQKRPSSAAHLADSSEDSKKQKSQDQTERGPVPMDISLPTPPLFHEGPAAASPTAMRFDFLRKGEGDRLWERRRLSVRASLETVRRGSGGQRRKNMSVERDRRRATGAA
ncbi:unnamed protein product [Vitrella brassicaformis CCMP3155]|uniref:Uncharacterized protein n=1 Tax=Vitrella brassicaformis (strain CCMP3155) TaxID=1169540 RepID=A0A0G4EVL7_VITBC|nr:unnamed protein product [Vitrella brassicaformis CCMP3155]|eukprot:CEM02686.1 unnamed protein product [Vitrella brassicaformis CCMP3155]